MPSCLGKTGKIKFENGIENNERNLHDNWKKKYHATTNKHDTRQETSF